MRGAERRRYNSYTRVAKRTAKQIECDGGPVPAWPSLAYLYSYRCIGKVGSLLASAIAGPLLRLFANSPAASQHNGHKYEKLVQSAARGRFIAYELSDLSIAYPVPSDRVASDLPGWFLASVRYCERLFQGTNPINHPTDTVEAIPASSHYRLCQTIMRPVWFS